MLLLSGRGPPIGAPKDWVRNFIPCGVARARVDEVVRAAEHGEVARVGEDGEPVVGQDGEPEGLWLKWHEGRWSEPGRGGRADAITRCGGSWANLVAYAPERDEFIMIAEAVEEDRTTLFLLTSPDALHWSEPPYLHETRKPDSYIENPTLVAPEGTIGREFEIWYQDTASDAGAAGEEPFSLRSLSFTLAR